MMQVLHQLKKMFSIVLIVVTVWFGTALTIDQHPAAAKRTTQEATEYNVDKGGDSVDAYRSLQRATYAYRNEGLRGEGSQTGRLGERVGLAERTGGKLQKRMDNRRDLTSQTNAVDDAAENMMQNTKGAFRRAAGKVQKNLNLND
ncbi:MAG: hypothetical protein NW220_17830 [Leptolyngbyaceae cyanobacterium bins.349]|nr:hypothetical protein [Leptolyngbyaceae cyanobacterium bins.349]